MQKLPLVLDVSKLKKYPLEKLQAQSVTSVLLALGSNHHAEYYLPRVCEDLAALGQTQYSTAFKNPDFTATLDQPKPDYINQCVYLLLTSPTTLQQLQQLFKQFEGDCNRQRSFPTITNANVENMPDTEPTAIRQVTMDIDILLVKLDGTNEWIIMTNRYPFKVHESAGVIELNIL